MNCLYLKRIILFTTSIVIVCSVLGKELQTTQQGDSILKREMFLEAEYTPSIRDANKVNALPKVEDPKPVKATIEYASWAIATPPDPEVVTLETEYFESESMLYDKKGYVTLGGGNLLNIRGAAGYEAINTKHDFLRLSINHFSTNGNANYVQSDAKEKAKLNDNLFHTFYKHRFNQLDLNAFVKYGYTGFNYYGDNLGMDIPKSMQVFQSIKPGLSIKSTYTENIDYEAAISYTYFTKKYGQSEINDGLKESDVFTTFQLRKALDNFKLGLSFGMHNLFYQTNENEPDITDYSAFSITPFVETSGEDKIWKIRLGANLNLATYGNRKFSIAPDLLAEYDLHHGTWLYFHANGGRRINTQSQTAIENRYLNPAIRLADSFILVDTQLGIKTASLKQWFFNAYLRYQKTKDQHFFFRNDNHDNTFSNAFDAGYYDKSDLVQLGGRIAFNHRDKVNLSLQLAKNFWDTKYVDVTGNKITTAINAPEMELNTSVEVAILPNFKTNIGFEWQSGRYGLSNSLLEPQKMGDIQNVTFRANYIFNRTFSIYLQLNNLLNKNYDYWYSYPEQGFSALAGFSFMFH